MHIFILITVVVASIGFVCAITNRNDLESSNIILGVLSALIIGYASLSILNESNTSIINTYCTKYYSNNVAKYNECKYNNKDNFSQVIKKGIK